MKDVNFVLSDREQYAITAHNQLANIFRELIVFGCERKTAGHEAELVENY